MRRRVFREKKTAGALKMIAFVAVVIVAVFLVFTSIGNINSSQSEQQLEIAKDAVMRAAVQCYALESQFPPSIQHLVDHYGLTLNEEKYIYHYRAIGSNIVPEIQVFPVDAHAGRN